MRTLCVLVAIALATCWANPSQAAVESPESARINLNKAVELARKWQPDAHLVLVNGFTDKSGKMKCDMPNKFGWRYKFYSAQLKRFYDAVACGGAIEGEMTTKYDKSILNPRAVPDNFADSPKVIASVRQLQKQRKETGCGNYALKLLFGQPDDHGEALSNQLLWDVYYQCPQDKEQSRRALLDGKSAKPLKGRN